MLQGFIDDDQQRLLLGVDIDGRSSLDLERYCHVRKRFLPVSLSYSSSLSFL